MPGVCSAGLSGAQKKAWNLETYEIAFCTSQRDGVASASSIPRTKRNAPMLWAIAWSLRPSGVFPLVPTS